MNPSTQSCGIGTALADAKQEYYASSGLYGPYDEKVIETTAFYGLPIAVYPFDDLDGVTETLQELTAALEGPR